jgi:phosphate transport system substrate-binding protein
MTCLQNSKAHRQIAKIGRYFNYLNKQKYQTKMRITFTTAAIIALFGFAVSAQEKLSVKGSDTINAKLMPRLADAYKAAGNKVTFEIEDKGSSSAFTNLQAGTADIGASSRAVKPSEMEKFTAKGQELVEHVAAIDMIAVILNEKNKVSNLSLKEIEGIFTGEITDWSEVGGRPGKISVYTRNETSGTYATFQKLAMAKRDYGTNSQKMEGNRQIATEVAGDKNGIGYVGKAYASVEGCIPVSVDGISFSVENKDDYAVARKLYYYTVGQPKGTSKKFLEWAKKSDEAAKIVAETGFIANQ